MLVLVMVYEYLWRGPLQGCLAPPHSFIVWQILSQFQSHSQVLRKECLGLSNKVAASFRQGDMILPVHGRNVYGHNLRNEPVWGLNSSEQEEPLQGPLKSLLIS